MSSLSSNSGSLTYDSDKVIKILLRGAQFKRIDSKWNELFEVFVRVVQIERVERTVVSVIIEPLASRFCCQLRLLLGNHYLCLSPK